MRPIIVLVLMSIVSYAYSQNLQPEFGKLSQEEIQLTTYEQDPDAEAVILFDIGESKFIDSDNGYDIKFIRHRRIKIFNKKGLVYSEFSIPLYSDGYGKTEIIKSIEATTFNVENGASNTYKLDKSNIYVEQLNKHWSQKKFALPRVQEGSILDIKYELITPFHFNLPDWTFQDKIPTIYSEYKVAMIPFYEYIYNAQGINRFDHTSSVVSKIKRKWGHVTKSYGQNVGSGVEFQDYVHTYVMKDVPAFKDESYITSINDYIIKMDFQLAKFHSPSGGSSDIISTWPALNEELLKNNAFGKYIKSSSKIASKIFKEEVNIEGLTTNEKAIKIIEYVKQNFTWNEITSKYAFESANSVYKSKTGNSAEINLLLIALLHEADIAARPVILSTRSHGKIASNYPFDHYTNYVIALIETDTPYLADATNDLLPYNRLPLRCYNEKGIIVDKSETPYWIDLKNSITSLSKRMVMLSINKSTLDVEARVSLQATEYEAYSNRRKFKNDTLKIKDSYEDKIGKVNSARVIGMPNNEMPYSIYLQSLYETEKIENSIIVKPFLNLPISKNHLTQSKRTYPIDFIYPWNDSFECTLEIPEGYKISEIPSDYHMENELSDIHLTYKIENNLLFVNGNYKFKKSIYNPKEYPRIKHYMDVIVERFNAPVFLENNPSINN